MSSSLPKPTRRLFCLLSLLLGSAALSHAQLNLIQTVRYTGPSNVIDQARAIGVDAAGNTYLTGSGDRNGPLLGGDIVTIKCAPSGAILWTARYENPGRLADAGTAIALDSSGFIYVTGYSHGHPSLVTAQDFVTLKYAPDGTEMWARRFSGPTNDSPYGSSVDYPVAIATDGDGHVYVTGSTGGSAGDGKDYVTIKYDDEGNLIWSVIYDSPEHGNDHVTSMALNSAGEVFVGGYAGVVKLSSTGAVLWQQDALILGMAVSPNGDLVAVGPTDVDADDESPGPDFLVSRFSTGGDRLWQTEYNGAANEADAATAVRIDAAGNIYVAGNSAARCQWVRDSDSGRLEKVCASVLVTLKLDADGRLLWAARHGHLTGSAFPIGLELDVEGNAYLLSVEGTFTGASLLQYTPDGVRIGEARYRDAQHGWDTPTGLALDAEGLVHVGGYSYWRDGSSDDYFVLRYSTAGIPGLPGILTPPQDQTVAAGGSALLNVIATGPAPLRYQWYLNDEPLAGGTNAALALNRITTSQGGDYSVEVRNDAGAVLSPVARVNVTAPALQLRSPWSSAEGFGFEVEGPGVSVFVVEASTDLKVWTAISTNVAGGDNTSVRLPPRPVPSSFFRARVLP